LADGFGVPPPEVPPPPVFCGVEDCTVTTADAALVVSAWLVAITVSVPPEDEAVYRPDELIVPKPAFQVTAVLVLPETEALN
jgi:hypothetical protein